MVGPLNNGCAECSCRDHTCRARCRCRRCRARHGDRAPPRRSSRGVPSRAVDVEHASVLSCAQRVERGVASARKRLEQSISRAGANALRRSEVQRQHHAVVRIDEPGARADLRRAPDDLTGSPGAVPPAAGNTTIFFRSTCTTAFAESSVCGGDLVPPIRLSEPAEHRSERGVGERKDRRVADVFRSVVVRSFDEINLSRGRDAVGRQRRGLRRIVSATACSVGPLPGLSARAARERGAKSRYTRRFNG